VKAVSGCPIRRLTDASANGEGTRTAADQTDDIAGSRLLYSVAEAARLLGVGRTYMFRLIAAGEIESIKVGKLRKIPRDALGRYIDEQRPGQGVAVRQGLEQQPRV
jgi:excisionase family DNA binding protein